MLCLNTGVTLHNRDKATEGYILVAPCGGTAVHLITTSGEPVHSWRVGAGLTFWCSLLPDGTLFTNERSAQRAGVSLTASGIMRAYDAGSRIVWEHKDPYQHHDARRLESGGAIYAAYCDLSPQEAARVRGGVPGSEPEGGLCGEVIREVDHKGRLVWERKMHEFGTQFPLHANANRWSTGHVNTIVPLGEGRYLLSCKVLNLVLIYDRTADAITWHYQNDEMGGQHDAQMLENGNILLFANGAYASDLHHSQVWEIDPATNTVVWAHKAQDNPQSFFSPHIGGCQRLASGNTLVCEGSKRCLFEVTPTGEVVWEYVNPHANHVDGFGRINWLFRARHYPANSPHIQNLGLPGL